jgi:hypothetical protein
VNSGSVPGGGRGRPTGRLIADVVRALRGWVVAVAGGVLLLGAYLGISKQTDVSRQIPYLVSGGLGGLALVMVGSALVVADKIESSRDATGGRLARQVDDLHALIVAAAEPPPPGAPELTGSVRQPVHAAAGGPPPPPGRGGWNTWGDRPTLVAVPNSRSYHLAGCELVTGKSVVPVTGPEVAGRGLSPCPVCEPPAIA